MRHLCRTDLYFLLRYGMGRKDMEREWLFQRCREVQAGPNDHLDLWAREHYKSTIITFAMTIQDILSSHGDDPLPKWNGREVTVGIFSHSRPIAKGFLRQIKRELEANPKLKEWFPDIVWQNPQKESPKWSEDEGIVVRRKSNPKEATVEAWGLVDGQPIGKHFFDLVYDDVVTRESVNTPEMIAKTTEALELSFSLGTDGGNRRFIGTRYHFNDTYRVVMERDIARPRIYPATDNGDIDGEPALLSRETLAKKRKDMGPYTFSCQMMQNPKADETQGFLREWLRYYRASGEIKANNYMLVDAANGKRPSNDYTAIWVIGLMPDGNYYVQDIIRDRLNLTQRARLVMDLHRKWRPIEVRYERYGLMADVQHIQDVQERENYRFDITEVGGQTNKNDRIKRLIPLFEQHKILLPHTLRRTNYEGENVDLVHCFIEDEYAAFPVAVHDDMLDALARIAEPDLSLRWPEPEAEEFDDWVSRAGKSTVGGY